MSQTAVIALAFAAAAAGVMATRLWRVGRLAVTAVHEGGHVIAALMAGHTVTAVHLCSDSSGVTFHRGRQRWSSRVATAGAGYVAPGLVAIGGAALTANQESRVFLAMLTGLGALMVVGWVRNLFGIALVGAGVLAMGWLLAAGTTGETLAVSAGATWYLAMGGLRASGEQLGARDRGDAFELGKLLHLPGVVCRVGFVAFAAVSVLACIGLMFYG